MTSEELAAAGLSPNRDVSHESEDIHVSESDLDNTSARDSESREEGEVGSEEDLGSVEADLRDLVSTKRSKSLHASFNFGESKVTTKMIREYEAAGYFPTGDGRAPLDEQIPTPAPGEVVVFRDFFTCGLRFPCDPMLVALLEKFSVKINQLSPNSFLELSKFFWIMRTFRCSFSTDVFARLFELVIEPKIVQLNDGQYQESHFSCCTFNTRRHNTRRGLTRIQIAPCCKTKFAKDWNSYWFYVKVDISKISSYEGSTFPLSSPIAELTATCTAPYNHHAVGFRNCESAFHLASKIFGGRDIIEEFVATNILFFNVNWAAQEVPFPRFKIQLPEDQNADDFMDEIEKKVNAMIGESTMNKYKAFKNLVKHKKRINRVFSEVCGDKSFRSHRPGIKTRTPAVAVASCSSDPSKISRRLSSKDGKAMTTELLLLLSVLRKPSL
jgi:uncharacterized protein YktA (UPF0223 family)